ncbi:hypothetical protein PR048_023759 [Dryococelus australis]|uniref:DUF4371 domain-containing protein n=1 Tax=Dryococelus australis TaxID=614101 RepID=A0ABQ9GV32_9NEOP|nr:hypothetical protein PR048_023759 [Dryococelus australis]
MNICRSDLAIQTIDETMCCSCGLQRELSLACSDKRSGSWHIKCEARFQFHQPTPAIALNYHEPCLPTSSTDKLLGLDQEWNLSGTTAINSNEVILYKLFTKVYKSKCFSVLFVETADISGIEQVPLCIWYVESDTGDFRLRDDFLQFILVTDLTGRGLVYLILKNLEYKFNYEGISSMSGKFQGAQAAVRVSHRTALYVRCSDHAFNLAVSKSCEVQTIRNCLGMICLCTRKGKQCLTNYVSSSPEEYFRVAIYISFLYCFISELNLKFSDSKEVLSGVSFFFPGENNSMELKSEELDEIKSSVKFYISGLESGVEDDVTELQLWRRKCIKENPRPSCAISGLSVCNKDIYPNISTLLKILATLLVSTATPER